MKKKYQVFISSTYTDLIAEREAVQKALLKMRCFPVGMEQFSASNKRKWEIIKDYLECTDYYILILGKRYGSVIEEGEDEGISYTEKEFNYARELGIPVIVFIKSDDATYKASDIDKDARKIEKLEAFTEKAKAEHQVEWFDNPDELAGSVAFALHNVMEDNGRPGWVRGTYYPSESFEHEDNDGMFEPTTEYEVRGVRWMADGKHKKLSEDGVPIAEGEWKRDKLIKGIEFDSLVRVTQGQLIYKSDCPEDPYDATEDFQYERLEQYGWQLGFSTFSTSIDEIVENGIEQFYVADFEVEKKTEHMINIRTLEEFLSEKDPEQLEYIKELIEEKDDIRQ